MHTTKMSNKPSVGSTHPTEESTPDEEFGPPEVTSLATLTDGRTFGDFKSSYPPTAWLQILLELLYLVAILIGSLIALICLAKVVLLGQPHEFFPRLLGNAGANEVLSVWFAIGLSGAIGGSTSALKWLYHTVAKKRWHRDRVIWRLLVPILSAVLAVFSGLMITSGLLPFFSNTSLMNPAIGAAFGFFAGLFSDNVLASLQRLAHRVFGTVEKSRDIASPKDTT